LQQEDSGRRHALEYVAHVGGAYARGIEIQQAFGQRRVERAERGEGIGVRRGCRGTGPQRYQKRGGK